MVASGHFTFSLQRPAACDSGSWVRCGSPCRISSPAWIWIQCPGTKEEPRSPELDNPGHPRFLCGLIILSRACPLRCGAAVTLSGRAETHGDLPDATSVNDHHTYLQALVATLEAIIAVLVRPHEHHARAA